MKMVATTDISSPAACVEQGTVARKDAIQQLMTNEQLQNQPKNDDHYFSSYAHIGIHEEMLKDRARTEAYQLAIMNNPQIFRDKVVFDVGCGTGILSIFCAKAGARKVYAIEASGIAKHAEKIIEKNDFSHVITVINKRLEDITDAEITEKADVIVSEWMGYFLLYESMLDTVLIARDRWLKPDGYMYPSRAVLYLSAFSDDQYYYNRLWFWNNTPYGVDLSPLVPFAKECAFKNPLVDSLPPMNVICEPQVVTVFDIKTVTLKELMTVRASLNFSSMISGNMHGFVGWFDTLFDADHPQAPIAPVMYGADSFYPQEQQQSGGYYAGYHNGDHYEDDDSDEGHEHNHNNDNADAHANDSNNNNGNSNDQNYYNVNSMLNPRNNLVFNHPRRKVIKLSTSPEAGYTHWMQTIFFFSEPVTVEEGQQISCDIEVTRNKDNIRHLDISFEYLIHDGTNKPKTRHEYSFK